MKIVKQNIKNSKQRQQHRSNQQSLALESPERSDDVNPKSNEDLSKSQVSIKEDLDNSIIEELIKNGSLKVIEHGEGDWGDRPTDFDHLKPNRGNPTFETNSLEELQIYISKHENSDNPKHRTVAQKLKKLLSQMNPPENAKISISVED